MKLADRVQELIDAALGGQYVVKKNVMTQSSSVSFYYPVNEQEFSVTIETDEVRDAIKFFIYTPFKVLPNKMTEMALFINRLNAHAPMGAYILLLDGYVLWRHSIDFEKVLPSVESLNNNLGAGINIYREWFEELSAVALTKTTAQDIFDQLNEG